MAPPRRKRKRRPAAPRQQSASAATVDDPGDEASPAAGKPADDKPASKVTVRGRELVIPGPEWRRQDLLLLSALTGGVLVVVAALFLFSAPGARSVAGFLSLLVLIPAAPLAILFLGVSVFIAMPIAHRITKRRRLKFFEVLAYSAVIAFLCALTSYGAFALVGGSATVVGGGAAPTPGPGAISTPLPVVTASPSAHASASASAAASARPSASATASPSGGSSGTGTVELPAKTIAALGAAEILSFAAAAWVYPPVGRMLRGKPRGEPARRRAATAGESAKRAKR
jgi:hypothetical protein